MHLEYIGSRFTDVTIRMDKKVHQEIDNGTGVETECGTGVTVKRVTAIETEIVLGPESKVGTRLRWTPQSFNTKDEEAHSTSTRAKT
ncbi:hypothetical protein EVAR_30930_1 [Eumeta japonica]|uniref:Uncharacterized protein n=1 Tax=Eumeta variegata TaxID=151549 RepID=A0A4C1V476_EUMVA|nr:hypothetical protein EVAR_30930_1 [Eumeta japonica]